MTAFPWSSCAIQRGGQRGLLLQAVHAIEDSLVADLQRCYVGLALLPQLSDGCQHGSVTLRNDRGGLNRLLHGPGTALPRRGSVALVAVSTVSLRHVEYPNNTEKHK